MNWYLDVLKKYADFKGRARRKEYWMFVLFNVIISIVISSVGALIEMPLLGNLYSLAVLLPGLAVGVRRLHDINKSGWYILIALIPLIGAIWLLILLAKEGDVGENQYGPNPKEAALGADVLDA